MFCALSASSLASFFLFGFESDLRSLPRASRHIPRRGRRHVGRSDVGVDHAAADRERARGDARVVRGVRARARAVARERRGAVPSRGARGVRGRARGSGRGVRGRGGASRGAVPRRGRAHAQRVLRRQARGDDPVRGARSRPSTSAAPRRLGRWGQPRRQTSSNVAERCSIARRPRPPPRVARHPVRHSSLTSPRASPPHPSPSPPPPGTRPAGPRGGARALPRGLPARG